MHGISRKGGGEGYKISVVKRLFSKKKKKNEDCNGEQIKREVGGEMRSDCDQNCLYEILEEFMKIHYF